MAGARIEITNDTATPAVRKALQGLKGPAVRLMLSEIGEYLVRATRERAATETSPAGEKWAALSPRYKRFKDKKRPGLPILRFDFHMIGDQFTFQVGDGELQVGTNAKYGAIHQFGGDIDIAARSQQAYFKQDRNGDIGNRFVSKKRSNFAQWVTLPRYKVHVPARPWLGLSQADEVEVVQIGQDHLENLFK